MPLDPRARRLLDILAAANPPSALSLSVAERRDALAQLMKMSGPGESLEFIDDFDIPGPGGTLAVRRYTPAAGTSTSTPGLVYFHGGGLVAGTIDTHDRIARALATACGYRVLSVGYRLAPEHQFPAAVEDAVAAVRHVIEHAAPLGLDPKRIVVCGDSAGATLAAVACQELTGTTGQGPALQVLICPILDHGGSTESRRQFSSGYLVDQATLDHDLLYYLPAGTNRSDPRVSPLRSSNLSSLPPTIIHTAEFDPLRDEGHAFAKRISAAGPRTAYTCHPGMIHLFYGLAGVIPYARTAFAQLGVEIRAAIE